MDKGRGLAFHDAVRIARGCTDYGGGYRSDDDKMEIYQHGIQTVINALEHAERNGLADYQIAVLHSIGGTQDTDTTARQQRKHCEGCAA